MEKLKNIRLLIVDIDGVMTDGTIMYGNYHDDYRTFHIHDGFGFKLWHKAGFKSAIITGKRSKAVLRRAKELRINYVFSGVDDKLTTFKKLLKKIKLDPSQACYVGDDLYDLPVLKNCGFSVTVPQAPDEVRSRVDYVTKRNAGKGAVREVVEIIIRAQNKWDELVKAYL